MSLRTFGYNSHVGRKENAVKRFLTVLLAAGICGTVLVACVHEGHKTVKGGASSTASAKKAPTAAVAEATLPASSVEKVSLTGELIDPQCWFTHNGEGEKHAECAVRCARGGQDLAFLDSRTGEVHTMIAVGHGKNPNDGLYEHVGVPVLVRGTLYKRGTSSGLLLEAVEHAK